MNITLDASDFAQLADFWSRAPKLTAARLTQAMTICDLRLKAALQAPPPDGLPSGAGGAAGLRGSITTEENVLDDSVIGMVATAQPYAVFVELGTKPHWAPIQPIMDWVKAKLGLTDLSGKQVAYAIRAAIAKRGTKANPVWRLTFQEYQPFIRRTFDDAMSAIARDLAGAAA